MIACETLKGLNRLIVTAMCLVATALVIAPPARALSSDPFTPKLSICTDVNPCTFTNPLYPVVPPPGVPFRRHSSFAGTTRAGAHPDLTVKMQKTRNGCHQPGSSQFEGPACNPPGALYLEQDLKKMLLHLPPGLIGDVNAAPSYCDAFQEWGEQTIGPNTGSSQQNLWWCKNPDAAVGTVDILGTTCGPELSGLRGPGCLLMNNANDGIYNAPLFGVVYNERPRAGEQARLVLIAQAIQVPSIPDFQIGGWMKIDMSVKVRDSDTGIDVVADGIPPMLDQSNKSCDAQGDNCGSPNIVKIPFQTSDILMTLNGSKGKEKGHPLLTNPTFCGAQSIDAVTQGYDENPKPVFPNQYALSIIDVIDGQGLGKTDKASFPYQVTGCDALPYSPAFTATSDTNVPGNPVALSTVITQKDGEATTNKVDVEFPEQMGINLKSSLKPCGAAKPNKSICPDSVMGSVEAFSRLLPIGETLKGDVFLTGLKGDKLSLSVLLSGFIDLRLDATAGVDPSGRLTATFDELPSVPLSKFTLNLAGGNNSLITNPRKCGDLTTKATFTSHSGKTHVVSVPVEIKGCSGPTFDAELTEPAKGKRTGIELEVSSDQTPIKEIKFGLDRHMKLTSKGLGKKRKFGEVSVTTASGTEEAALKRSVGVKQKEKKAFSLKVSALKGLGVNVYRKSYKSKKKKASKDKKSKKSKRVLKNRVSVKPLPKNDTSKVVVSLNPDETKLLRNPKGSCYVNVIALVKDVNGVKYALKKKLKLRGKGCSKKKVKKKS